jgi:predicted transcriptional regulator
VKNISKGYNKNIALLGLCYGLLISSKDVSIYKDFNDIFLKLADDILAFTKGKHNYNISNIKSFSNRKVRYSMKELEKEEIINPILLTCKIIRNLLENDKTKSEIKEFINTIIDNVNVLENIINNSVDNKLLALKLNLKYRGLANRIVNIYFS